MDPATLTATDLVALIRARKLSAVEATQAALARTDRLNPGLNAIVQMRSDGALADAAAVDAALARGEDPGPLAGVPVTVKVNIDQQGFATTNGLRIQQDLIAPEDSPPVRNLRRAGAIIIGRTNTVSLEIYNAVTAGEFDRALWLSAGLGAFSTLVLVVLRRHDRSNG